MPPYREITIMRRVLNLAQRGRGTVSPNPRVGAVIVDADGTILGEGYHKKYGGAHAEVEAINSCHGKDLRNTSLYLNLEPCCHHGHTPPCVDAIKKSGVRRVVVSNIDPNPKVNGKGIEKLRESGVDVTVGLLDDEARYVNRGYFSYRLRNRAWCSAKIALSLDGKMANPDGMSKWITGPEARKFAHALRADHDGILVGGGTVLHDNPELTVRLVKGISPKRFILSPKFGIPHDSLLARTASEVPTYLICNTDSKPEGADIPHLNTIQLAAREDGLIDPKNILRELPDQGVLSLMIEGGSETLSTFMEAGLIDEISVGIAPSVIGKGISPFERFTPKSWEWRPKYAAGPIKRAGADVIIVFRREGDPFSLD